MSSAVVAFLSAREDERQEIAQRTLALSGGRWVRGDRLTVDPSSIIQAGDHIAWHDPTWTLADVAAKRAVIAWLDRHPQSCTTAHPDFNVVCGDRHEHPLALALVQPYADHPDFDPSWTS